MKKIKNTIFIIATCFVFASFSNCGASKNAKSKITFHDSPPFIIENSYYQDWMAGVQQGGTGTRVYITFDRMMENVVIKDIFYKKMISEAKTSSNERNQYKAEFKNEQKDFVMDSEILKEAENTLIPVSPFDLVPTECVISYTFKKELYYYKVKNMERKEALAYPQGNPNLNPDN